MHQHSKRAGVAAAVSTALALAVAPSARAQTDWKPGHAVTIVVPYDPGGGTDATARTVARRLSELWQQPVTVENVGGADGLIGTRRVVDARPDGYTLLFQVPSLVLMKYQPSMKGIDPLAHLVPITAVATSPPAVVVTATLPFTTLAELVAHCRAHPCNAGSGENISKLAAQQFAADFKLRDMVVVSYKGTAPIISDLVSGNLTMAFTGITAAMPLHDTGRLRILVTQGDKRAVALPNVPTSEEAGWANSRALTWYGVFAPKGTPAPVAHGIADAMKSAGADAGVRHAIALAGAEPAFTSPEEFAQTVRDDEVRMAAMAARFPFQ
jgi:tripartite-type tricarboxylate transporter receptor subunit TctC